MVYALLVRAAVDVSPPVAVLLLGLEALDQEGLLMQKLLGSVKMSILRSTWNQSVATEQRRWPVLFSTQQRRHPDLEVVVCLRDIDQMLARAGLL